MQCVCADWSIITGWRGEEIFRGSYWCEGALCLWSAKGSRRSWGCQDAACCTPESEWWSASTDQVQSSSWKKSFVNFITGIAGLKEQRHKAPDVSRQLGRLRSDMLYPCTGIPTSMQRPKTADFMKGFALSDSVQRFLVQWRNRMTKYMASQFLCLTIDINSGTAITNLVILVSTGICRMYGMLLVCVLGTDAVVFRKIYFSRAPE